MFDLFYTPRVQIIGLIILFLITISLFGISPIDKPFEFITLGLLIHVMMYTQRKIIMLDILELLKIRVEDLEKAEQADSE